MSASLVSRARGLVAVYLPREAPAEEREEALWFAATVLHDLWRLPVVEHHPRSTA